MQQNTVQTGYAPVNGAQLYYEMTGEGMPLILLHAGVADGRMWDEQFTAFARQYRVIRFDYRGFGRSAMPPGKFCNYEDVASLLDYLGAAEAILVGISFGGLIAIDFALAYPERVLKLTLAAPSVSGATPSERIKQFWKAEDAAFERGDLDEAVELNLRLWVDGIYRQPDEVNTAVRQKVALMQREIFEMDIPDDIEEVGLEPVAYGRVSTITT
ncbi:MAG: alpha/beta hydrolase, partial [Chloroflexi bacterium]|nr:alpha/beta hydrolase [Chloroflexota bacterium]